jgi:hypothetical protein
LSFKEALMAIKYADPLMTPLKDDTGRRIATLLWGDPVHVLDSAGGSVKVRAHGREWRIKTWSTAFNP